MSSEAGLADGGHIPALRKGMRAPSAARIASTSIGRLGAHSCDAGSTDTISSVAGVVNGPHSLACSTRPGWFISSSCATRRSLPTAWGGEVGPSRYAGVVGEMFLYVVPSPTPAGCHPVTPPPGTFGATECNLDGAFA